MRLSAALRCGPQPRLAFTGAGGKTTAMFRLARELAGPVLVTTSTHLGVWQLGMADRHWVVENAGDVVRVVDGLAAGEIGLITGGRASGEGRVRGASQEVLTAVSRLADLRDWPLLVEADGSRQKPLKAPAAHEPVIPAWANLVVVTAGLSGLAKPLVEEYVHRLSEFSTLAGVEPGISITPEMLTKVLLHPDGGLKGIPAGARRVALLNQADTSTLQAAAQGMAPALLSRYDTVLVSRLREDEVIRVSEPVAGIILAAGASRRFGQPKVMLDWHGQPFVRHVAKTALSAGLDPVRVVVGAQAEVIRRALAGLPVQLVENPEWEMGQSSSLQAGLAGLPGRCGAAVFLLADQPHIPAELIEKLVDLHSLSLAPVVAPRVDEQRANPVLFDRVTFDELLSVQGDIGGRALFTRYEVEWYESDDRNLLLDVDTPTDYETLLGMGSENE